MNKNKIIGNITELKIMTVFMELGYNVSSPYGDCERYDFIADINGMLIRIQCKTATSKDKGKAFEVDFRVKKYSHGVTNNSFYEKDAFDYFATYFNDKCYLIPMEKGVTKKRLRLEPTLRNQQNYISWAKDYELEKVIAEIERRNNE